MDFKERDFENESISKLLSYKFEQNPIMTPAKGFENNFASKSDSKSDVTINENRIKRLGKDLKCTLKPSFCELFKDLKNAIDDDIKPFTGDYKSFGESVESNLNLFEEPLSWHDENQHSHLDDQIFKADNMSQDPNIYVGDRNTTKTLKRDAKANSKQREEDQAKSILCSSEISSSSKCKKKSSKNTVSFTNLEEEEKVKQSKKETDEAKSKNSNNRKRGRSTISRIQPKSKNQPKNKKNQQESRMKVIEITEEDDLIDSKKNNSKKNRRLTILIQKSPVKSKCEVKNDVQENIDQEMAVSPDNCNEINAEKQLCEVTNNNSKKNKNAKKESRFDLNGIFGNIIMEAIVSCLKCCICLKSSKDCNDAKPTDSKHIEVLLCNLCKLAVHSECYYGEKINKSSFHDVWECERCNHCVLNKIPPEEVKCKLCPNISGALRKLNGKQYFNEFKKKTRSNKDKDIEQTEIQWAHVVCLLWIEELSKLTPINYVNNKLHSKRKSDPLRIDIKKDCEPWRLGYKCRVCEAKSGALIKCSEPSCRRKFHVTCAVQDRLITKNEVPFDIFCKVHKSELTEIKIDNQNDQIGSTCFPDPLNLPIVEFNESFCSSLDSKKPNE